MKKQLKGTKRAIASLVLGGRSGPLHKGRRVTAGDVLIARTLSSFSFSQREVAALLHFSCSTISKMLRPPKAKAKRAVYGKAGKRIQRRRNALKKVLKQEQTSGYPSAAGLAKIVSTANKRVCRETIRTDLHALGLCARVRPRCPRQVAGDDEKRRLFAIDELALPVTELRQTIFTDEKRFTDNDSSNRYEWLRPGVAPSRRSVARWGPSLLVYGAIGIGFKFLVFFDQKERLTADRYKSKCLIPLIGKLSRRGAPFRIMQDGAPCHRAKKVAQYLTNKSAPLVQSWPPRSPHLNPIENLWALLARRVSDRIVTLATMQCAGVEDAGVLKTLVQQEWDSYPQSHIDNLIRSYESRLIEARDGKKRRR